MKRTAILFDMDGLMVDTEPLSRQAWARVVAPFGAAITDDLYNRMLGIRTAESARLVLAELDIPLAEEALLARKADEYVTCLAGGVPVMPGLWTLLERIEERGLPWAIATSSLRPMVDIVLGKLGLAARYGALVTGDEVVHGKPAPDIYLLAAERLGVDPATCLALEDSPNGCAAAAAAGARVLVVPTDMTRHAPFPDAYRCYSSLAGVAADLEDLLAS